jgi:HAD superfamily hydrolase (TIGR01549 family)
MATSSPFDVLIFDLDNTLVSTDALEEFRGHENVGRTDDEYVRELTCALSGNESMRFSERIPKHTLESIRSSWSEVRLAVFTRGPRRYAETVLEHCLSEFRWDLIVARENVAHTKPAPDGILKIVAQLGPCVPERCVVIGDNRSDIEAAYSAGVRSAWWSAGQPCWGKRHKQEMLPDWVLKCPDDVYRLLHSPGHVRV